MSVPASPLLGKRTYSGRLGRFSPAQRHAYQRLHRRYCIPFARRPLRLHEWFAEPQRALILEIGSGMGDATAELASRWGDKNYIAIEVHLPGVGKLLARIEQLGLTNLRIIAHDAIEVACFMLPPAAIAGLHLFFPDPWPKRGHHKRRLVQPGFAELMVPLLTADGYLSIVTDWQDYAEEMLALLNRVPSLINCYDGFALRQSWRPLTAFEHKGLQQGRRIYELYFRRQPAS